MRSLPALRHACAAALVAALAACAPMPPKDAPKPVVAPQITEDSLRARAQEQLSTGLKLYDAGDFDGAAKSFSASLDHGLLDRVDQSRARKYLAFIHCVGNREPQCAAEFRKAFEINATRSGARCTARCARPSSPSARRRRASPGRRSARPSRCWSTAW